MILYGLKKVLKWAICALANNLNTFACLKQMEPTPGILWNL